MSNILIIETHPDFSEAVKNFIAIKGIKANVFEATTAQEGINLASLKRPEVVIMDVHLGEGINGLEVAAKIKKHVPSCGIILLTMYSLEGMKNLCKTKDIAYIIDKNELDVHLIPAINRLVQG